MAGGWLFWLGAAVGLSLAAVLSLGGYPLVGLVLGAAVALAARAAVAPAARSVADDTLRRACDRLPFCDCGPSPPESSAR